MNYLMNYVKMKKKEKSIFKNINNFLNILNLQNQK